MDTFLTILFSAVFFLWIIAAVLYPLMEEREERRFNKNNVNHTDGDNT